MWIGSYKLQKNVYPPDYINEQIKQKVGEISKQLKLHLAGKFTVTLDTSRHSEACYVTIKNHWKEVRISFRNHDGDPGSYDLAVYLYRYKTWTKCERDFIRRMLPKAMKEIEKTP